MMPTQPRDEDPTQPGILHRYAHEKQKPMSKTTCEPAKLTTNPLSY